MKKKFVDEYHWIEENEMLDLVAIAQSSPGPIAVNGAIVVGQIAAGQLPAGVQLVQGVAALVDHGEQGGGHHVGVVVGGDAHVVPGEVDGEVKRRLLTFRRMHKC